MNIYGERLFYFRKKILNITQEQLGESIGYSKNSISSMETGVTEVPETVIYALCYKWGLNEAWFRTGEGPELNRDKRLTEMMKIFEDTSEDMKNFMLYVSKGIEEMKKNS